MKAIAIIPARMGASRFPGKPLAPILGMPMIGHCYERTRRSLGLMETYVATCDEEIATYVRSIGGKVIMTSSSHNRATDRTAEAMLKAEQELGEAVDVVVMVQGDEPLIRPETISRTLEPFSDPAIDIANIMSRLRSLEQFQDRNNVKVVVNKALNAMYFSREAIPSPWKGLEHLPMYMQVGVIAFRREALIQFNGTPETSLEKIESVDMNRVLESGGHIKMILTEDFMIGVDTQEEALEAGRQMAGDPLLAQYIKQ